MASQEENPKEQKKPTWPDSEVQEVADALGAVKMGVLVNLDRKKELGLVIKIVHNMNENGEKKPFVFLGETDDYTTLDDQNNLGKFPFEKLEINKKEGWVRYSGQRNRALCTIEINRDCKITRTIQPAAISEPKNPEAITVFKA